MLRARAPRASLRTLAAVLVFGFALLAMPLLGFAQDAAAPTLPGANSAPAVDTSEVFVGRDSAGKAYEISAGDTAWMLTSAALVLMMTGPGLALFYGGLVRRKNVLSTMMQS